MPSPRPETALLYHIITLCGLCASSALVVRMMMRVGRIDRPGPRSSHTIPTPKGGGVGIAAAFVMGMLLLGAAVGFSPVLAGLLASSCGLAAVAFLDDVLDWPFWSKLAAQALSASVVIMCGITLWALPLPWLGMTRLGLFGAPLAFCWLVFATNAMNFIDGLNGLAAGVTLIGCVFLGAAAWGQGGVAGNFVALSLGAGVVGFLPYNFPRARIFMGDVGSQLCGFGLASLGLLAATPSSGTGAPWLVPMLLFAILYDVAFTLVRRLIRRERLTQAHRDHLYQLATRCGMPASAVTVTHWGMAAWGGACALLLSNSTSPTHVTPIVLLIIPQICWTAYVLLNARNLGKHDTVAVPQSGGHQPTEVDGPAHGPGTS